MDFLIYLIIAVVVILLIVGAVLFIQAKRRKGGVIVDPSRPSAAAQVMSRLMRTSEIAKRPVVTFAGEDVAQIKDIVYGAGGGAVGGFTLAGRACSPGH